MFFRLDEPVAQRNKPVCLLRKPVFRAYMLWRLYSALEKKERVREGEGWREGREEKSHSSHCVDKETGERGERKKKSRADNTDPV